MRVLVFVFFASFLLARSNPFAPVENEDIIVDSRSDIPAQLEEKSIKLPADARVIKRISITHQDVDGSINKLDADIEKLIDWHEPIVIKQPSATKSEKNQSLFAPIKMPANKNAIEFLVSGDNLKIETADTLIREFFLPKPSRVVLDFGSKRAFENYAQKTGLNYFTNIEVNHYESFYRVIISLDSFYPYQIAKVKNGYLLGLN